MEAQTYFHNEALQNALIEVAAQKNYRAADWQAALTWLTKKGYLICATPDDKIEVRGTKRPYTNVVFYLVDEPEKKPLHLPNGWHAWMWTSKALPNVNSQCEHKVMPIWNPKNQ